MARAGAPQCQSLILYQQCPCKFPSPLLPLAEEGAQLMPAGTAMVARPGIFGRISLLGFSLVALLLCSDAFPLVESVAPARQQSLPPTDGGLPEFQLSLESQSASKILPSEYPSAPNGEDGVAASSSYTIPTSSTVMLAAAQQQRWTVSQVDGLARIRVQFRVSKPVTAGETYASHQIQNSPPGNILTAVEDVAPIDSSDQGLVVRATLRFDGVPGSGPISVRITAKSGNVYSTIVVFTVRGLALSGDGIVTGSWKKGLHLGSWERWSGSRRFAILPIIASPGLSNGLEVGVREVPFGSAGTPVGVLDGPENSNGVDVVELDGSGRACGATVQVASDGFADIEALPDANVTALVFRNGVGRPAKASLSSAKCGVGFTEDGRWLVIRLKRFVVGTFGFQIRLVAQANHASSGATKQFGMASRQTAATVSSSYLNCYFDTSSIPPPVFPAEDIEQVILDPYGGELLAFAGVLNSGSPPLSAALREDDFILRETFGGITREKESALITRKQSTTVEFQTPEWDEDEVQAANSSRRKVEFFVKYQPDSDSATSRWLTFRQKAKGVLKRVIFSGDNEDGSDDAAINRVPFAPPTRASLGACDGAFKGEGVSAKRYATLRLGMQGYLSNRFSQHKADQVVSALSNVLGLGNVRFFEFDDARNEAIFEASVGKSATRPSLSRRLQAFLDAGDLARKTRLDPKRIGLADVSLADISEVCLAVDAANRNVATFDGIRGSPFPWVLGLVSAVLYAAVVTGLMSTYALGGVFKRGFSGTSSAEESDYVNVRMTNRRRRGLTDRQRDESFGLHQGPSRHCERNDVVVHIQPDTETSSQASEQRLSSPRVQQSPIAGGFTHILADRRNRGRRRGEDHVLDVEEVYDEETTETTTNASVSDVEEVYSASSMRRESREERKEGYVSQSDPLVARLTHALRSQDSSSPQYESYIARDAARDLIGASPKPYAPRLNRSGTPTDEEGSGQSGTVSGSGSGSPVVAYSASSVRQYPDDRPATPQLLSLPSANERRPHVAGGEMHVLPENIVGESTAGEPVSPDMSEPQVGTWEPGDVREQDQAQDVTRQTTPRRTPDLSGDLD